MSPIVGIMRIINTIFFVVCFAALGITQSVEECMDCHSDDELTKFINDTVEISLYVDLERYQNSLHGDMECIDCHSSIEDIDHEPELPDVNCADCHDDSQEEYQESIHAKTHSVNPIAAICKDCHSYHYVLPSDDPESRTYVLNIQKTCGECHTKPEVLELLGDRSDGPVPAYEQSVHSRILHEDPDRGAPTCTDCHGYHEIYLMSDYRSSYNKMNVASTCGECHNKVKAEYLRSIHWESLENGHWESPTCNDCHGEHEIFSPKENDAVTNRLNVGTQVCANCHSSPTMMKRFGLDPDRIESYERTYHGLALLKGSPDAANCNSCHETHAILSNRNPESSVYPQNLAATCGKCHEDVSASFVNVSMHPKDMETRNPIAYFAQNVYIWLIVLIIGGMVLHNIIIIGYYVRKKREALKGERTVQRFMPFEVWQHALLFLSFFVLVITGFALKFPEAGWVKLLVNIGMTEAWRSNLHRIAAVVLIAISLVQLGYFLIHKRGRKEIKSLRPQIDDVTGFWANMKFHLGFSKNRPKFGRFDYTEKAEYLALIWGTAVMALTGFVLWFPEFFMRFLPSWMFEVSEIIHYFEAWLATLAIIVWHWFFVIYHPEKYPMSITWMNGRITEEELKHHHPLEYDELAHVEKPAMRIKIEPDKTDANEK
jgi:cytochrome b subunit of formate dehydrogenase/nitrate/TMAO reductase-like tetraheme cytochrome c subunit